MANHRPHELWASEPPSDSVGWWLWRAQAVEWLFARECQEIQERWGPNGTERKWRKKRRYQNKLIADYYAKQGETVPTGKGETTADPMRRDDVGTEQQPENHKKLHHPEYRAMKQKKKVKRRKRSAVARKARRRIRNH